MDILRGLDSDRVARSHFLDGTLPTTLKIARVDAFLRTLGRQLPIVLKPDRGQRGSGVVIIRTREELEARLARTRVDTIVQEYVEGVEFGVFYVRRPGDAHGCIVSITEKRLPSVTGDGHRTIEQLILTDADTIGMARFHMREHAHHLDEVPARGQVVMLGDCGSHCRGARFFDAGALLTPALAQAIDAIATRFDGFYFGRFDLRVPTRDALTRGEGITILELNGVTSEVTHIYDPEVSVTAAYRALCEQWRLAFEIGAANAASGARVWSLLELAGLLVTHAGSQRAAASTV